MKTIFISLTFLLCIACNLKYEEKNPLAVPPVFKEEYNKIQEEKEAKMIKTNKESHK